MSQDANFQVFQASAGSGKTYTIVKEYLKLCLGSEGQTDNFRHILAITFTNASANDMKSKIVNQLHEIIEGESFAKDSMPFSLMQELNLSEASLKRNAQLLLTRIIHDYSSFCVSTIDAFVQKLSRSFAHDLGLPSQYTVSIDNEEIAEAITNNIGLQIEEKNAFLVQLLLDFSENQFANERNKPLQAELSDFVMKLMSEKAYQRIENTTLNGEIQYKQTLDFMKDKMHGFEQKIKSFVDEFKAIEQRYGLQTEDYWQRKSGVQSFINKLAKRSFAKPNSYFYTAIDKRKCLSDPSKQEANEALLSILEPLRDFYDKELGKYLFFSSQRNLLYLYALRAKIVEEFEKLAQEEEVVHISEFNKLLNSVMGDFSVPFVYERIGEHFTHIFVDEFQDTSVLQWQNLLPLVDNGLSNNAMSMVVGDGKQSIYRFRSGEVEQIVKLPEIHALPEDDRQPVFQLYEQNLKDHFHFENLGANYRSFENVVEFNNAFFEWAHQKLVEPWKKVYKAEKDAYGKEVSIHQHPMKKEKGLVQVELYQAENHPDYCFERIEALIRELTEAKGYCYADITLLTRRTEYGSEIANYLNDRGIPVISQESILLKSSHKVQLLVNTLRYLLHPENKISIANILYFRQLTQENGQTLPLNHLFEAVNPIVEGTTEIENALGLDSAGLFRKLFSKSTCLYDLCASLIRVYRLETPNDAFLNYFMDEVYKFQNGLQEGIEEFLTFWDKKQDKLAVKSVSGNAVKIMTIHKSKGLEFNVVIYPEAITDLDEKLRSNAVAELWIQPQDIKMDDVPNLDKVLFKLGSSAELMGEKAAKLVENEKESNRLDNLNLLYVALTRAKQRLYLIARQSKDAKKQNLMEGFLEECAIDMKKVSDQNGVALYRFGDADFSNPDEKEHKELDVNSLDNSISMDWFQKINIDSEPSMFWISPEDKMQPREWGDLVHQILSKIQTVDDIDSALQPYLLEGTINQETADILKDKVHQMAKDPQIAAAFVKEAKVKNECEILCDGEILRPDRYAELPDVIYLLDYKTGKKDDDYRVQLKNYIFALQGMVTKEIRGYLVYLHDPIEVEKVLMDTLF